MIQVLKKDLKNYASFLLFAILVPVLFSWMFSQLYAENIPFGVVDNDNSTLSRTITKGFEDHPGLAVQYVTDQYTLEQMIDRKELYGGAIIPKDFSSNISSKKQQTIVAVIDATNMVVANSSMSYISTVVGTYSAGAEVKYLQAGNMQPEQAMNVYNTFKYVDRTLSDPYMSYMCYLMYLFLPYLLQVFAVGAFGLPVLAGIHERVLRDAGHVDVKGVLKEAAIRLGTFYLISTTFCWTGYVLADLLFGLPVRCTMLEYFVMMGMFTLTLLAIAGAWGTLFKEKDCIYFLEAYMVVALVALLTNGAIWPTSQMPTGFIQLVGFIWPFAHVAIPFKQLMIQGAGWNAIIPATWACLKYTIFWQAVSAIIVIGQLRKKRL